MLALTLAVVGLAGIAIAGVLLRSVGRGYRLGRMLWAAPQVPIADAAALTGSAARFVRVTGRVSSDEEFPDEHDRPLVFRRRRVQVLDRPGRWRSVVDDREAVPFGVEARSEMIEVDTDALGDGLVVVPREAGGIVADLPVELRTGLEDVDPATPARLVIEQISAVEQATVAGQPVIIDGRPALTAGMGRPLIVTTLEPAAAMRLLAAEHRSRVRVAAILLIGAAVLLVAAALQAVAAPALAASPATPAPTPVLIDPLDPRTGANANLVGAPLLAALAVVVVGALVCLATIIFLRLAGRRKLP